jgi:hypothetical protein
MIIEIKLKGKTFFKSQVRGSPAFIKNVVLLIRNQDRVLFVDYLDDKVNLGKYSVSPFLEGHLYFFEVIEVPKEYIPYLPCIAKAIEEKFLPVYKNKKLSCTEGIMVVIK